VKHDFFVVLDGVVEIVSDAEGTEWVLAVHMRGCFTGELKNAHGPKRHRHRACARLGQGAGNCTQASARDHGVSHGAWRTILATFLERRALMAFAGKKQPESASRRPNCSGRC
jgi:hypothetical protein